MTASFFKFRLCAAFLTASRLSASYPSTDAMASLTTCNVQTNVRTLIRNKPSTLLQDMEQKPNKCKERCRKNCLVSPFQTIGHRSQYEQRPQFLEGCRDALGMPSELPLPPCSALHQLQTAEASVCKFLDFKVELIHIDILNIK
jgi:hypothetical protein